MILRLGILASVILVICLLDLSHVTLDEMVERLLYCHDEEDAQAEGGPVTEAEAEKPIEKEGQGSAVVGDAQELTQERADVSGQPVVDNASVESEIEQMNRDFEEDIYSSDDFVQEIYEAGNGK